jgi:ABC-type uncharacterized transport system substrate-binding protein
VKRFARPDSNITGIAEVDLVPKRMEIFRELVPGLKRVSLVYDATDPDTVSRLEVYRTAAQRLGLMLVERPVRTEDEARTMISAVRKGEVDGFLSPPATVLNIPGLILEIAPKRAIPAMFHDAIFVEQGGLASYSSNLYELGRQAARLVGAFVQGLHELG